MEGTLNRFLLSERVRHVDSETLRVYLLLYADAMENETATAKMLKAQGLVASGFSVHTIALRTGLPDLTVKRKLDDLARREWIKRLRNKDEAYQVGVVVDYKVKLFIGRALLEKPKSLSALTLVRRKLKEDKSRIESRKEVLRKSRPTLSRAAERRVLVSVGAVDKPTTVLLREYKEAYRAKYGDTAPLFPGKDYGQQCGVTHKMLRNFYAWTANDLDEAVEVLRWMFSNWENIRAALGSEAGRLDIMTVCSKKFYAVCHDWMRRSSIPEARVAKSSGGVAGRVRDDDIKGASDEGW